jgi:hypothetical protein
MPPDTSAVDELPASSPPVPGAIREVARLLASRKLGFLFAGLLGAAGIAQLVVLWALSTRPPERLYVPEATSLRALMIEEGSRHE